MALTDLTRISTSGIATGTSLSGAILHGDAHFRGDQVGINSAVFDSSENELNFKDNVKLNFGDNKDLTIQHNGSNSYVTNDTGSIIIIPGYKRWYGLSLSQEKMLKNYLKEHGRICAKPLSH